MNSSNAVAGILAGLIAFACNSFVQFLLEKKIDFFSAFLTAFFVALVFFLITLRYPRNNLR
ncbi:MAG: hypothetical protein ABH986_05910 [archaeon]